MATHDDDDVITLLLQQHDTIRDLMSQVELASPSARAEAFEPLVRLLAVHETAEEIVVHPAVRSIGDDGRRVVAARLQEEDRAKKALAQLEALDPASAEFMSTFAQVRDAVVRHAELEEREEFPLLVGSKSGQELRKMASRVRAAEAIAPTHPHASAPESRLGNMAVGPFVAIADRVRDAIRGSGERPSR